MTLSGKHPSAPTRCFFVVLGVLHTLWIIPSTTWSFEWDPPGDSTILTSPDPGHVGQQALPAYAMLSSPPETQWEPDLNMESQETPLLVSDPAPAPATRNIFLRSWITITAVEFGLLAVTASMPKDWTGWSNRFIQDGLSNLGEAYTNPPVWDDDFWFHNYVGHPYGGSVYYNTTRSQGASVGASFLFVTVMSTQWEYFFEAFAERPSIQDLLITPVTGTILGEGIHRMTLSMKKNGTSLPEKAVILVLNPMSVLFGGGFE